MLRSNQAPEQGGQPHGPVRMTPVQVATVFAPSPDGTAPSTGGALAAAVMSMLALVCSWWTASSVGWTNKMAVS